MGLVSRIGRQLNLLDYALSSLCRKWVKNLGVGLVFSLVIFLFSSLQLMSRGLTDAATAVLEYVPDITVQQMSAGRQVHLNTEAIARLGTLYGIMQITPRIWGYYFDESNGANYTVIGLTVDKLQKFLPGSTLAEGRLPKKNGEVVISEDVRNSLRLGDRRSFSLFQPDLEMVSFNVTGTFGKESSRATADIMLMSLEDGAKLFALPPGMVTDLLVAVGNPLEIDTIAAKITELLPGVRVITRKQIRKTYEVVFSWRSGFGVTCLLASLAAFIILAWDRASGLTSEDLREVGILKILGWQARDVMAVRFWESIILSVSALVCGYSLAWVHLVWGDAWLFKPLLLGWSVLRPEMNIIPPFSLQDLLLLICVSVLPYLGATVIPAWRSGVVRPDSVI